MLVLRESWGVYLKRLRPPEVNKYIYKVTHKRIYGQGYPQKNVRAGLPTKEYMDRVTHKRVYEQGYPQKNTWTGLPTKGFMNRVTHKRIYEQGYPQKSV